MRQWLGKYVLDENHQPVAVDISTPAGLIAFAMWLADISNRRVAETMVGDIRVSTVFLGIDHNFDEDGPPILFETMVFGLGNDGDDWDLVRYETWAEAQIGHNAMVERVRASWRQISKAIEQLTPSR